jgi:hypothetical protein
MCVYYAFLLTCPCCMLCFCYIDVGVPIASPRFIYNTLGQTGSSLLLCRIRYFVMFLMVFISVSFASFVIGYVCNRLNK